MKVYEIISKNEELNEGIKSKVFGGALDALMRGIGKGSTKHELEELARFINHEGKLDIDLIRSTRKWGPTFADELERNPGLVKKIENLHANKLKDIQFTKNVTELKKITANIKSAGGTLIEWIKAAASLYIGFTGFIEPIQTYINNIDIAEQRYLDTGNWSTEEFEIYRRREVGALVGKLTESIVTLGAAKVSGGIAKGILQRLSKLFGLKGNIGPLGTVIDGLTTLGAIGALKWMNNEQNASIIANQLASPIIGDITANDVAGGAITTMIDAFKGINSQTSGPSTASTDNTTLPVNTAQPANTAAPANGQQPASAAYNPDDWEYYSPSLVKNKTTGEINFKPSN